MLTLTYAHSHTLTLPHIAETHTHTLHTHTRTHTHIVTHSPSPSPSPFPNTVGHLLHSANPPEHLTPPSPWGSLLVHSGLAQLLRMLLQHAASQARWSPCSALAPTPAEVLDPVPICKSARGRMPCLQSHTVHSLTDWLLTQSHAVLVSEGSKSSQNSRLAFRPSAGS